MGTGGYTIFRYCSIFLNRSSIPLANVPLLLLFITGFLIVAFGPEILSTLEILICWSL